MKVCYDRAVKGRKEFLRGGSEDPVAVYDDICRVVAGKKNALRMLDYNAYKDGEIGTVVLKAKWLLQFIAKKWKEKYMFQKEM